MGCPDGGQRVVGQHQAAVKRSVPAELTNFGRPLDGRISGRHKLLGHLWLRQELPDVPHGEDGRQEVGSEDARGLASSHCQFRY